MNLQLTPELEQLVEAKVRSGRYGSAAEVVGEALRLLDFRDDSFTSQKERIRRQIDEGFLEAQRGRLVDGDEVFDRIEAELDALERDGNL